MAAFSLKLRSRKIEKLEGKLDNRAVEMRSKEGSEQHLNEMQILELKAQLSSIYSKLQERDIEIAELRATNKNLKLEIVELKKEAESSRLKVLEADRELESKSLKSVIGEKYDKFKAHLGRGPSTELQLGAKASGKLIEKRQQPREEEAMLMDEGDSR